MKVFALGGLAIWLVACASGPTPSSVPAPPPLTPPLTATGDLLRATPESQGISSTELLAFIEDAEENIDALHSIMLVRHGRVVAEGWWNPYGPEHPHELYSLSKSFTSTAIGMAIDEGLLDIDDPVLQLFPDEAPEEPSEHLQALRVRQLLSMSTGHTEGTMDSFFGGEYDTWAAAFLAQPVNHKPGTFFMYNTGATYMQSAIITKLTGQSLVEYLQPRLFEPLGIATPYWHHDRQGINTGGWGLNLKTEDIARFGQLYLQQGLWRGEQLVSAAWIEEATARQVSNGSNPESDWDQGYGYQFWRCRHDAYRGDGAFGQYCLVLPEQDAVLAITSGVRDMQHVLDAIWDGLLPAMHNAPLPEDQAAHQQLSAKLESLAFPPQQGAATSPLAAKVAGKKYRLEPAVADTSGEEWQREATALSFAFDEQGSTITLTDGRGEQAIRCGHGEWLAGRTQFDDTWQEWDDRAVAASGAWTAEDTYVVQLCFYETPYRPTITFQFTDDGVLYDFEGNVGWGDPKRPQLIGRAE